MPRPKKDPFEDLDPDFKESIEAMTREEIRNKIASIAIAQTELMKAKDSDQALQEAKETAKEAGAVYRDGTKMNKLRIAYASQVLDDKGGTPAQ